LLFDTNVISELVRESPDPGVVRWLTRQDPALTHLSAISLGELAYGIARMPTGSRRSRLESWLDVDVRQQFAGRLLDFGERQALAWGGLRARCERQGIPRGALDLQIAATAAVADLALCTRNTRDFDNLGIALVDPWHAR
jgi:predicted nucleic acid-binding protein